MARFTFRLARLLRLKEAGEKERQRELAARLREAEAAHEVLAAIDLQMLERQARAREARLGPVDPWRLLLATEDLARLQRRRDAAEERLRRCVQEVDAARARLTEAMRGRKSLEALRERDYRNYLLEEERSEQRLMDELAQRSGQRAKQMEQD